MGGRGGASGLSAKKSDGKSTLQSMLEYTRSINQKKMDAVRDGTNVISYDYNGKTYHQYYYGGAWHDRPSTLTRTREYQSGDMERIIASQKNRGRKK